MNKYIVEISFEGRTSYTIEAPTADDAKYEAQENLHNDVEVISLDIIDTDVIEDD